MPRLWDQVREAVENERYVVSAHADLRLRERRIEMWQVEAAMSEAKLLLERPNDLPHPAVEVEILLPHGTPVKAVWSWLTPLDAAKLVTVHDYNT